MRAEEIRRIIEVQLPSHYEPLLLTFYGNELRQEGNLIIFGDDSETNLCLNPEDGFIYSVDPQGQLPTRFVNTSVDCLAKFLAAHRQCTNEASKTSIEAQQLHIVRSLGERLAHIDSRAFGEAENWWAVVLEQLEDGLL